ncbi:MAG: hypothetical protein R3E63_06365 [Pseudomonadales bacterium]
MKEVNTKTSKAWLFYVPPLAIGLYLLALCLFVMFSRLTYPYELEWMEGAMFQVVMRVVDGLPIYTTPSMDYVPPLYAPLYFYVAALATKVMGEGLPALRLVSLLASLGTVTCVGYAVWLLTRSRLSVLLSVCCWAALYALVGSYYDAARLDSLWAFWLTGASTCLITFSQQQKKIFLYLMVLLLLLAVFTKQTTLSMLPFFFLALWLFSDFRTAFLAGLTLSILIGAALCLLQWQTKGLFYFYTMEMARAHKFIQGVPMNFLHGDMLTGVPIYLGLCASFILMGKKTARQRCAWLSLFSGFFLMSLLSRWYSGGWINVLLAFHQLIVVISVAGFWLVVKSLSGVQSPWVRNTFLGLMSVLLTLNMARAWIHPNYFLPTEADRACGDSVVAVLKQAPGDRVCVSKHTYLAFLADKKSCAHEAWGIDVMNGSSHQFAEQLQQDVKQQLLSGHYSLLLLDNDRQFKDYDVHWNQLPYTATDVDCPTSAFFPKLLGPRPMHWLRYNGKSMDDQRSKERKLIGSQG